MVTFFETGSFLEEKTLRDSAREVQEATGRGVEEG